MRHYEPFRHTGYTFEERATPSPCMTALGEVVYWFAFLRDEVDAGIEKMLGLPAARAAVLTVQAPFPDRVSTMAALARQLVEEGRKFNAGDADPNEVCGQLAAQCLMAHRLRDQVMDSSWGRLGPDQLLRSRGRVHAASGLRRTTEATDAARLMDIADGSSPGCGRCRAYQWPELKSN